MTEREALAQLRLKVSSASNQMSVSDHNEVYKVAIKALEKQIPKKVEVDELGLSNCPTCDCTLIRSPLVNYCPHCGQRIDWEET